MEVTHLTYKKMLGRRNEILKRHLNSFILKNNREGLSGQEHNFYQSMLKELYQGESQLNSMKS
ncbi:hypothetical protein SAMN04487969_106143 [Paenibacillus algorifonticola]|uniref:Uncharacterized protein n=1 Tax=Paenibacillus algorifonticola TaxID=684063 RepID=A0A1I2D6G1_9BACL|nr:hypothetical protein SAMN04487969_106143 [Paenibacillus algorifonticola]